MVPPHPCQQRQIGKPRLQSLPGYSEAPQVMQEEGLGTANQAMSLLSHPLPSLPTVSVEPDFCLTDGPPSTTGMVSEEAQQKVRTLITTHGNRPSAQWCQWRPHRKLEFLPPSRSNIELTSCQVSVKPNGKSGLAPSPVSNGTMPLPFPCLSCVRESQLKQKV